MSAYPAIASALPEDQRRGLDVLLAHFDRSWGCRSLARAVRRLPPRGPFRQAALGELVRIDLARQWHLGRRVRLEAYLKSLPELGSPASVPVELIQAEYEARRQAGELPDLGNFARRFPPQVLELRRLLNEERHAAPAPPMPAGRRSGRWAVSTAFAAGAALAALIAILVLVLTGRGPAEPQEARATSREVTDGPTLPAPAKGTAQEPADEPPAADTAPAAVQPEPPAKATALPPQVQGQVPGSDAEPAPKKALAPAQGPEPNPGAPQQVNARDLAGSVWTGAEVGPNGAKSRVAFELHTQGMTLTEGAAGPAEGYWWREGAEVTVAPNLYRKYIGTIKGNVITGRVRYYKNGGTAEGTFTVTRQAGANTPAPQRQESKSAGITWAGTKAAANGRSKVVMQFQYGGKVTVTDGGAAPLRGTWRYQAADRIIINIATPNMAYLGTVDADSFVGEFKYYRDGPPMNGTFVVTRQGDANTPAPPQADGDNPPAARADQKGGPLPANAAPAQPGQNPDLAKSSWSGLFTYVGKNNVGNSFMTLIFAANNQVSLSNGKKGFIATFTQKGNEVTFPITGGTFKGTIDGDTMSGSISYFEIDVLNMTNQFVMGRFSFRRMAPALQPAPQPKM